MQLFLFVSNCSKILNAATFQGKETRSRKLSYEFFFVFGWILIDLVNMSGIKRNVLW